MCHDMLEFDFSAFLDLVYLKKSCPSGMEAFRMNMWQGHLRFRKLNSPNTCFLLSFKWSQHWNFLKLCQDQRKKNIYPSATTYSYKKDSTINVWLISHWCLHSSCWLLEVNAQYQQQTWKMYIPKNNSQLTHFFIKNLAQGLFLLDPYLETSFNHFVVLKVP